MLLSTILLSVLAAPAPPNEALTLQAETRTPVAQGEIEAGLAAYRRLRFRDAERHFQAAVEADPQSAPAHFYLGYTVYKIAEPKRPFHPEKRRAAELFARAYELDPFFKPVWAASWRGR
jgi:tetratricopeptide (TPR) repeat protein